MSRRLKPLPLLEGDQRRASDPVAHAALSASAGTGKTQVLTARVLRLLLGGVRPEAILCLTFTKAGAAEMANRLGERLASWVRLDDVALRHELFALDEDNSPPMLQRARRLFARVVEAPGGLRIQTIHSFAQTLLASFPAEAGVVPGFQPIEGRAEAELARRTLAALLADAEAGGEDGLIADVQALSLRLGEQGAESYLMACARAPEAMAALGDRGGFETLLRAEMGVPDGDVDAHIAGLCNDSKFDCGLLRRLLAANQQWDTATGRQISDNLAAWLAASPAERAATLRASTARIVKADFEPNASSPKQRAAEPDYDALAAELAGIVRRHCELAAAAALARVQAAGLRAGAAFAHAYAKAKRAAGVADFDDLIRWTRRLFEQQGMGEWVRFKLDQRTDHVLVDEAQDTNADQWAIVEALAGEFFSGSAEVDNRWRTLFMVGDYKQAIYSFQGTDPRQFEAYRRSVADRAAALATAAMEADISPREFRDLSINASFRSSPAVLQLVDAVIGEVGAEAMGLERAPDRHVAANADRAGSVELWPPFIAEAAAAEDSGDEGWIDEPLRLYADRIARQVRAWLDARTVLASTGQPITPGDILILVRSRTELASLIVARLFAQAVPVAGIDRLHLAKPLAVKDLLSAVAFAVQPHDSLNLGGLLVSPLVGWDQDQLCDLAFDRTGSLWDALQKRRDEGGAIGEAHALLSGLLAKADFVTPARFLGELLSGPINGRRKLLQRLGEAARDPIEELVSSALEFGKQETPSLDRFLAWFASGDVEVKRDASEPGNAVRVMTVHGAKGLEAPVVLLADATHDPDKVGGNSNVMEASIGGRPPVPLIRPRKEERVAPFGSLIEHAKARDLEEHWRLLYVALTRAKERLVVAGVQPGRAISPNSWHARTANALVSLGAGVRSTEHMGEALHWTSAGSGKAPSPRRGRIALPAPVRPAWIDQPAPQEEVPPRPLAPSALSEDSEPAPPPGPAQRAAARRGVLLHALFERLPGVEPASRHDLALQWLAHGGVDDPDEREEIASAACAVIADPRYAGLFAPEALAEAPIAATLPDGRVIAGTVDRLCVGDDLVRVIDFKTGRSVPADAAAVPRPHRLQMDAYAEALRVIFPGRRVEAALLYTHEPRLIALDG